MTQCMHVGMRMGGTKRPLVSWDICIVASVFCELGITESCSGIVEHCTLNSAVRWDRIVRPKSEKSFPPYRRAKTEPRVNATVDHVINDSLNLFHRPL